MVQYSKPRSYCYAFQLHVLHFTLVHHLYSYRTCLFVTIHLVDGILNKLCVYERMCTVYCTCISLISRSSYLIYTHCFTVCQTDAIKSEFIHISLIYCKLHVVTCMYMYMRLDIYASTVLFTCLQVHVHVMCSVRLLWLIFDLT